MLMADIKILVWNRRDAAGDPDVEVKVPVGLAKWVPRMMAFMPKKAKVDLWGEGADFDAMFGNLEQLVTEAAEAGMKEIMDVKAKEAHVKVLIEK